MPSLPEPTAYVSLSLLDGGSFIASYDKLHAGATEDDKFRLYIWAFYLYHPATDTHAVFDLGLSNNKEDYSPFVQTHMLGKLKWQGPSKELVTQLEEKGVKRDQIKHVFMSHAHFDHCRPFSSLFPRATGHFGPGTSAFCSPGHLSSPACQWDGHFFDPSPSRRTEPLEEFDGPWVPFGPFDKAMDFFGDGSLWFIQAPGHLPGNLAAAARVENGEWVVLGGDCCHSRGLLEGKFDIGMFELPDGTKTSMHNDVAAARKTIKNLRLLEEEYGAHIALGHDATWMEMGTDETLMGMLSEELREFARERLPKEEPV